MVSITAVSDDKRENFITETSLPLQAEAGRGIEAGGGKITLSKEENRLMCVRESGPKILTGTILNFVFLCHLFFTAA